MQLETLQKDMIAAMKARDKARKDSISSLISAVKKVAIDEGCRDDIKEELVDRVILDLLAEYQARYDVINEYAPSLMSEDEVKAFLTEKCADVIATKNKGMIMKTVMPQLKGKADGKVINAVVAELCK